MSAHPKIDPIRGEMSCYGFRAKGDLSDHARGGVQVALSRDHARHGVRFAPRKGETEEGDGYLLGVAQNFESMTSDLVIVDAPRMEEGAAATVKPPFRLSSGAHTNWFPATDLPFI